MIVRNGVQTAHIIERGGPSYHPHLSQRYPIFIPVAGELLGALAAAEATDIAAMFPVLGVADNTAYDVYIVIVDPDNSPLAIVSLIIAPLALAAAAVTAIAASVRRAMSAEELDKLGDHVSANE